ncbi:hypothetical protein EHO61_06145 [Leptospira fluminis]|uniref:Uncharacterized protein n=1 Tax=Leptospira fluminis TaxID=2484979 RepID=A0A4V3JEP6_9LEPT|nr:hypothetical protein [Leptospira fluminis]TGK20085.1 hypothetical protein EHO61_06145 [Leptospira fluminis]
MKSVIRFLFVVALAWNCKTPGGEGKASTVENPAVLRLNYDVVYYAQGNAVVLDFGRLFARGLYYDCKITDTASNFDRFRASSYTEDNANDFRYLVSESEQAKMNGRQFQYFPMKEDTRSTVFSGCRNSSSSFESCYVRWEWQRGNFIFVFETEMENKKGLSTLELGKEFHDFVSRRIRAF